MLPVAFYGDAFRTIDRLKPAGLTITHAFQTNGDADQRAQQSGGGPDHVDMAHFGPRGY